MRTATAIPLLIAALFGAGLIGCGAAASVQAPPLPLKTVKDVPIGAATRRFDYASVDPRTGLLFVADLAGSRVLAFDVRQQRLVGTIAGVQSVHGVLAVPELGRVYASATGVDQLVAIDEISLKIVSRMPAGRYPDGIAWEPRLKKLYVSDETGRTVAVVDAASGRLVRTIAAGGEVGNTQYDAGSGLIYSNEQTNDRLNGIDPRTDRIVSRDNLPGCRGAHGLLIEATRRLAFIACEDNAKLLTVSLARHAVVGEASIGRGPDVLAYDPSKGWLYVSSESGVVSMFQVENEVARKIGEGFLADNAHVVAVDPVSHRVFFPLRNVGGRSVLRVMEAVRPAPR
jgi:DNA-binding beta-propeller fold protein YncE